MGVEVHVAGRQRVALMLVQLAFFHLRVGMSEFKWAGVPGLRLGRYRITVLPDSHTPDSK